MNGIPILHVEADGLGALERRTFAQRTLCYRDLRELMEAARPAILEKVRRIQ